MRIISKKPLIEFYTKHPDAKAALEDWYAFMKGDTSTNFSELKKTFGSADLVGKVIIFDIRGNKYRLISSVHFNKQITYVLEVMTHAEYSKEIWKSKYHVLD